MLDNFALAKARQRVEQRDMRGEIIALGREMRGSQRGRPALQIGGQLGGQDQRSVTHRHASPDLSGTQRALPTGFGHVG